MNWNDQNVLAENGFTIADNIASRGDVTIYYQEFLRVWYVVTNGEKYSLPKFADVLDLLEEIE